MVPFNLLLLAANYLVGECSQLLACNKRELHLFIDYLRAELEVFEEIYEHELALAKLQIHPVLLDHFFDLLVDLYEGVLARLEPQLVALIVIVIVEVDHLETDGQLAKRMVTLMGQFEHWQSLFIAGTIAAA